jgi:hypothetical protein
MILHPDGTVDYMYANLTHGEPNSATVGVENATGTEGIQVTYNGSGPINPASGTGIRIPSRCPVPPIVPTVVITLSPQTMDEMAHAVLTWDDVGANQYHIYKSTTSTDSGFVLISSTVDTSYIDTSAVVSNTKSFYYVTADNQSTDRGAAQMIYPFGSYTPKPRAHSPRRQDINSAIKTERR